MNTKLKTNLNKVSKKGKFLFLAYDQGLEHGPTDFNSKNVDPNYIIQIAKKEKYSALVFQKGIAEKYNSEIKKSKIPLVIKLNGKTNLSKGEPISRQLCTVQEAIKLGAIGVGYTIYIGSEHENEMLQEFEKIQKEAHEKGLFVITWIYPRGASVTGKSERDLMAYSTRVGLELGADIIKIQPSGTLDDLKWAIKSAGKAKVVSAGGLKTGDNELINQVEQYMQAGFSGLAVGRNVWQHENPHEITEKLKKIIWKK
jgi:fructose-bisphosphate aldolase, class I